MTRTRAVPFGSPSAAARRAPAIVAGALAVVPPRSIVLAMAAAALAVASVSTARGRRDRGAALDRATSPGISSARAGAPAAASGAAPAGAHRGRRWATAADLGRAVASAAGRAALRAARRSPDADADRRIGGALLAAFAVVALGAGPLVAAAVGLVTWTAPLVVGISRRRRDHAALVDELPEVVDLVRLGVGSGLNVRLTLEAVVRHHDGHLTAELREVLARVQRGDRLADALDTMSGAATAVQPLVDALVATERHGAPLVAALDRVAADARTARRRRREEAARRVPVKLLFPLVFCTLPAFALLTVVPVLLRSLPSLAP